VPAKGGLVKITNVETFIAGARRRVWPGGGSQESVPPARDPARRPPRRQRDKLV